MSILLKQAGKKPKLESKIRAAHKEIYAMRNKFDYIVQEPVFYCVAIQLVCIETSASVRETSDLNGRNGGCGIIFGHLNY